MAPCTLEELQHQYDNFKRVSDHYAHADSTCHRCRRSSDTHQQFTGNPPYSIWSYSGR